MVKKKAQPGKIHTLVAPLPALFPNKVTVPACAECDSFKFVASLIDMDDWRTKAVTCENGHSFPVGELKRRKIQDVSRENLYARDATVDSIRTRFQRFEPQFEGSDDRVAAILASALFEALLSSFVRAFAIDEDKAYKEMIRGMKPLGTFSAKISFCYFFGLISEEEFKALDCLRDIRNDFAHYLEMSSFTDQSLADRARNLGRHLGLGVSHRSNPRSVFDRATRKLWGSLVPKLPLVQRCSKMPFDPIGPRLVGALAKSKP